MPTIGYSKYQKTISVLVDLILINISFIIGYFLRFETLNQFNEDEIIIILILNFSWWIIASQGTFPISQRIIRFDKVFLNFLRNILVHGIIIFTAIVIIKLYQLSRLMLIYTFLFEFGLILIWRLVFSQILIAYRKSGKNFRNVIILGTGDNALEMHELINKNKSYGYKFLGFFDNHPNPKISDSQYIHPLDDMKKFAIMNNVNEVFCALPESYTKRIFEMMEFCENNLIRFKIIPNFKKYIKKKVVIDFVQNVPVVLARPEPLESRFARLLKRGFDVLFSLLIILFVFSWLFPIVALLILLESRGPVFFMQWRTGKDNKDFKIYKFRSMKVNKDADSKQAKKGDMRITKLGKIIRKLNIDELPQFFNVLFGQMSVVGPRPHMLKHTEEYSKIINKYMVRHFVKPGITGWAQVNGYRGETETPDLMEKRVEYDVWYLENWSFILDLYIVFLTIYNMFKGEANAG